MKNNRKQQIKIDTIDQVQNDRSLDNIKMRQYFSN